jgi:hypothetical protein
MAWTATGVQSGTDTNLAGITAVTGVTVNTTTLGVKVYNVPASIGLLTINGELSWNPDLECLVTSDSTRVEQNQNSLVTIGIEETVNNKTRFSRGTGLIMNRQQASAASNTNACNWWIKDDAELVTFGGQIKSAGAFFVGSSTTPPRLGKITINGRTEFMNIHDTLIMQAFRSFSAAVGININSAVLSGFKFGIVPFSTLGFNSLSAEMDFASFQSDGNGQRPDVIVGNAVLAENKADRDYSYVASANSLNNVNKYIFKNPDVGSALRTLGAFAGAWRIGVVELRKDVSFEVSDPAGDPATDAVAYMKLNGASLDPVGRFAGVDNYTTPRKYIASTDSTGKTTTLDVLYAVAQGYSTSNADAGQPLTMDSLTTRAEDVHVASVGGYSYLPSQPAVSMRGVNKNLVNWTLFEDDNVTLSRTAALALIGTKFTVDATTNTITVIANANLDELYDATKAFKYDGTEQNFETPTPSALIVSAAGTNLTVFKDWNVEVASGVTFSRGDSFRELSLTGTGVLTSAGSVTFPFRDADGLRVTVSGLDPEAFGVEWYLRYKLQSENTFVEIDGTGNTALILVADGVYDIEARVIGYDWATTVLDTAEALSIDINLRFQQAADGTPQFLKPFNQSLVDIFEYDSNVDEVKATNTTGAILEPGFNEMYQVIGKVQHNPNLVWIWVNPVTTNATSQRILVPPTSPIRLFLSANSDASIRITCPVVDSVTGISADDRVKGNPDGFSIILGSAATADSSLIVSQLINQLGGQGFETSEHSLVSVSNEVDGVSANALILDEQLITINSGVQKASLLIPYTDNIDLIRTVFDYFKRVQEDGGELYLTQNEVIEKIKQITL